MSNKKFKSKYTHPAIVILDTMNEMTLDTNTMCYDFVENTSESRKLVSKRLVLDFLNFNPYVTSNDPKWISYYFDLFKNFINQIYTGQEPIITTTDEIYTLLANHLKRWIDIRNNSVTFKEKFSHHFSIMDDMYDMDKRAIQELILFMFEVS